MRHSIFFCNFFPLPLLVLKPFTVLSHFHSLTENPKTPSWAGYPSPANQHTNLCQNQDKLKEAMAGRRSHCPQKQQKTGPILDSTNQNVIHLDQRRKPGWKGTEREGGVGSVPKEATALELQRTGGGRRGETRAGKTGRYREGRAGLVRSLEMAGKEKQAGRLGLHQLPRPAPEKNKKLD